MTLVFWKTKNPKLQSFKVRRVMQDKSHGVFRCWDLRLLVWGVDVSGAEITRVWGGFLRPQA